MNKKTPTYHVAVYRPTLIAFSPDVIGFYSFDSVSKVIQLISEHNLKLKAKCEEYDDNGEVEAIVYYCEE